MWIKPTDFKKLHHPNCCSSIVPYMNKTLLSSCGFTRNYSRFNTNLTNKFVKCFSRLLLFSLLFCSAGLHDAFADGSKDLYRGTATAGQGRASLRVTTNPTAAQPYSNLGVHYVYAKRGERITMASSAMINNTLARIKLTKPGQTTPVVYSPTATDVGRIRTRTAEVAGPSLFGASNSYIPHYYEVLDGEDGIFKVEFVAPGGESASGVDRSDILFSDNFTQQTLSTAGNGSAGAGNPLATILAWDVSVININNNAFINGRVYANILNLDITSNTAYTFNGVIHVLTKDGYFYKVNNNGNNGIAFTFFVNNKGFVYTAANPPPNSNSKIGDPRYESITTGTVTATIAANSHDPNSQDTPTDITHKLFYTLPSTVSTNPNYLPPSSTGAVPGGTTWLLSQQAPPTISEIDITGIEGRQNQVSSKGGIIYYTSPSAGRYTITIASTVPSSDPRYFVTRLITGNGFSGRNPIPWDGKDGAGNKLPSGSIPATVTVQLQGAEVHFPFIDMEENPGGTVIQRLNSPEAAQVVTSNVYWNDPFTSGGTPPLKRNRSHLNTTGADPTPVGGSNSSDITTSHTWSTNYGDNRGMDTWAFILGQAFTKSADFIVKEANLEVTSITPATPSTMTFGGNISYSVIVRNAGPSDVTTAPFAFTVPTGFEIVSANVASSTLGATAPSGGALSADKFKYNSNLDMPNNSTITYTVIVKAVSTSTINKPFTVQASILRPADVTDPDATNPNTTGVPSDPQLECTGNVPATGVTTDRPFGCNNIAINSSVSVTASIIPITETGSVPVSIVSAIAVANVAANDTVNGAQATLGTGGNATVSQSGTWPAGITLDVTTGAITVAALTPRGAYDVTYQLCDKLTPTNCATVVDRVNVTGVAPVAVPDSQTGLEDNAITFDVTANDTDVEGNLTINKGSVLLIDPADNVKKTSVVIANQGTWTVNATTGVVTFTPLTNYNGSPTVIRYTVKDDQGLESNSTTLTATVTPVPDAPVAVADVANGTEETPLLIDVTANDTDPDGNPTINKGSVLLIDPADNVKKTSVVIANQGTWTVNATTGVVTFAPVANYFGTPTVISYTVKDVTGLESNAATISVT
ncbi:MAG: hypothetical protein EOO45_11850, partial [Flavobacterium sp.]